MATFAEQMVEKYQALLADSAGLKSVTVDGQPFTHIVRRSSGDGRSAWTAGSSAWTGPMRIGLTSESDYS